MKEDLLTLIKKHKKGNKPVFNLYPFISIEKMWDRGLKFNDILQNPVDMASATLLCFELGFESAVIPYDMNIEAEVLGAEVRYYEGEGGQPIYPTVPNKWVSEAEDIVIPPDISQRGRVPCIVECIRVLKESPLAKGLVGVFIPGPCTLSGQIMDLNELFLMSGRNPEEVSKIFTKLAGLIVALRDIYVDAGIDFIVIEDGGATAFSPATFRNLLLSPLKRIFAFKRVPHILSLTGRTSKFIDLMLECQPDGIGVDQENDIELTRKIVPLEMPLFAICGDYFMLVNATPEEIEKTVISHLSKGVTSVIPPADIWPPAKLENIESFINAVRDYKGE